ncbi:MAG: Holliday junction resolvase RuvX [Anaerolineae bacterium]|jgi:putative holliday junction resolvase|nr:Holliday junction resolvase RuvX [Anaerolineae bacterium]MBT7073365.1 Holliday junction resolvase RuvX [Anaerolineae bacterium]MBT7781660.1 Holliday junction resolvase RuvX [Anaerolineae bacterium]
MKILSVDPGQKNIGLAISDELGISANPLTIIKHVKREIDAAQVAAIALENNANLIIIGQSFDEDGKPTFEGRRSARFAKALRTQTDIPIQLWDESYSTQDARQSHINMGVSRKKRRGHLDDIAAAVILRSYLDAHYN